MAEEHKLCGNELDVTWFCYEVSPVPGKSHLSAQIRKSSHSRCSALSTFFMLDAMLNSLHPFLYPILTAVLGDRHVANEETWA